MTTIVGIKANDGLEGIVVASDRQTTSFNQKGELIEKFKAEKIFYGDSWIITSAGGSFPEVEDFYKRIKEKSRRYNPVPTAIKKEYFSEYLKLNKYLSRNYGPSNTITSILAVNFKDDLILCRVDPFGNIIRHEAKGIFCYATIGSGGDKADQFLQKEIEKSGSDKFTLNASIDLARGAINYAQSDPLSGFGLDMAVLTKSGVYGCTDELDALIKKTEDDYFENVKKELSRKK